MSNNHFFVPGALLGLSLLAGPGQAALIDNLDGTISDDVTGLMWLQDANLAASESFGISGIRTSGAMNWDTAGAWVSAMNAHDGGNGYLGYNDWRLPTTNPIDGVAYDYTDSSAGDTDAGSNISAPGTQYAAATGSDLAYMFYNNLDGAPAFNPDGSRNLASDTYGLVNGAGPFSNLEADLYWSATEYAPDTRLAWNFNQRDGAQSYYGKGNAFFVWAVRADAGGTVPLPGTVLLTGLGLLALRLPRRQVG